MKRRPTTAALGGIGTLVLALAIGLIVIYSGAYNVAATEDHWGVTRWALNTLQHRSVSVRAGDVEGSVPTDSGAIEHGLEHFQAMCVVCHGAPGVERGELGRGIRPRPPRLEEAAGEWSDEELFWITRHGIRLAGMPAFGPSHSDEEIWSIVGFLRQLETMTEAQYAEEVRALQASRAAGREGAGEGIDDGGHAHPEGAGAHAH